MNKEIILNKKKSIINSVIIPIIFCLIYFIIYSFMPEINSYIDENLDKQFIKSAFIFAGVITLIISITTFWGNEFFSEKRYKKNEMVLLKKRTELISFLMPGILGILLIIFIIFLPIIPNNNLLLIKYMKMSIMLSILISILNSVIIFWLIVLFSKEKIRDEK